MYNSIMTSVLFGSLAIGLIVAVIFSQCGFSAGGSAILGMGVFLIGFGAGVIIAEVKSK